MKKDIESESRRTTEEGPPYELPSIQELGDLAELTEVSVSIRIP